MTRVQRGTKIKKPLKAALALAELSRSRQKHAAIVMSGGIVVGAATNQTWESPPADSGWRNTTLHAEAAAIAQAGPNASGATIFVARVGASGDAVLSKPCKRCMGLIDRRGVAKVVHT